MNREEIENLDLPDDWSIELFDGFLKSIKSRAPKVLARDYRSEGRFPIVDQGQGAVAGYTNDEKTVISDHLPVIVFGDHTRLFKFVEEPFAAGADGTKLLQADREVWPLFAYFHCLYLNIPSKGYSRHYRVLAEQRFVRPPLPEQKKIAAVLRKVREAVEVEEALARNARDLKKSLMRQLFTRGLRDEPVKETEIGPVPQSWAIRKVGTFAKLRSGGTPSRGVKEYWDGGTIPWVKTGEVNYRTILDTEEKITPSGLANSAARMFPAGALLIAMYGQGITRGKVGVLGIEAATNQACAAILPDKTVDNSFLYYWLQNSYEELRQRSHGAQQKNLNSQLVAGFEVAHPESLEDQKEIARILGVVDEKIAVHEAKRDAYRDLFKTLLHQLMTAEIRVHELEIET